jgi:hypothetical protein
MAVVERASGGCKAKEVFVDFRVDRGPLRLGTVVPVLDKVNKPVAANGGAMTMRINEEEP